MNTEFFETNKYKTIFDMQDAANPDQLAIISEMNNSSALVASAPVKESSDGMTHRFKREGEFVNTAKAASLTEGYTAGTDGRTSDREIQCGRVIDARSFEHLEASNAEDKGIAAKADALSNMARSIIEKKAHDIMYGGHDKYGKEILGLTSYLENIKDINAMFRKIDQDKSPFDGEECLALSNRTGLTVSDASTVTEAQSSEVWTSVYGIAWGYNKVFTVYPKFKPIGGYSTEWHFEDKKTYTDPLDGQEKMTWNDTVTGEALFGVGVANRFCLNGLRNIYLDHVKEEDTMLEMANVAKNIRNMYRFFRKGRTDTNMIFFCNDTLLAQMDAYLQNRAIQVSNEPGGNLGYFIDNFDTLRLSNHILLVSDFAVKMDEKFVA
nr:MAG TPA: major capsid protein [Bacteriophage sp.]